MLKAPINLLGFLSIKRDSSVKSLRCYVKSSVDCKGLGLRNSSFRCPIITVCDHGIQIVKKAKHLSKSSDNPTRFLGNENAWSVNSLRCYVNFRVDCNALVARITACGQGPIVKEGQGSC